MNNGTTNIPSDAPNGFSPDNGHGKPTHLRLKSGGWVPTPKGYRTREDGMPSHKWLRIDGESQWVEVPSTDELADMTYDSICESVDGETVEPDHPRSWLRILGLI